MKPTMTKAWCLIVIKQKSGFSEAGADALVIHAICRMVWGLGWRDYFSLLSVVRVINSISCFGENHSDWTIRGVHGVLERLAYRVSKPDGSLIVRIRPEKLRADIIRLRLNVELPMEELDYGFEEHREKGVSRARRGRAGAHGSDAVDRKLLESVEGREVSNP